MDTPGWMALHGLFLNVVRSVLYLSSRSLKNQSIIAENPLDIKPGNGYIEQAIFLIRIEWQKD
jgi:hypothetical protein